MKRLPEVEKQRNEIANAIDVYRKSVKTRVKGKQTKFGFAGIVDGK